MPSLAISGFAQSDIKQRFVRAFHCGFGGQAGKLGHHAHETNRRHAGDERVVFRHVADVMTNLADLRSNIQAEHARCSLGRRMEAKQRLKKSGLAGAIRSEQTDAPAGVCSGQFFKNRTAGK